MIKNQGIFNDDVLNKHIDKYFSHKKININEKINIIKMWKKSINTSSLKYTKEKHIQGKFIYDFMVKVLDYKDIIGNDNWSIIQEKSTNLDGTTPDAVIGFYSNLNREDTRCIIELKDILTDIDKRQINRKDKKTPQQQAFEYTSKFEGKCKCVIISNFREIRLYNSLLQARYEKFNIVDLDNIDIFKKFYFLLCNENLIGLDKNIKESRIDKLYNDDISRRLAIKDEFYKRYKDIRINLFNNIRLNNPNIDELVIFEKCQKLIDRIIFICFCENKDLLEMNTLEKVYNNARSSFDIGDFKIYNELKKLFTSIDRGNPHRNINRFNGGLFLEDTILDNLNIKDDYLLELEEFTKYDFNDDLNVNILGHIFEQSITDIEEIKSQIIGKEINKSNSKRKRDGIVYTDECITNYIVKNTLGKWLENKKIELGWNELPELKEEDYKFEKKTKGRSKLKLKVKYSKNYQRYIDFWKKYREEILNVKILDPACGSGAFLNAAFNYMNEILRDVDENLEHLVGDMSLFDLDIDINRTILQNNIYGIDINEESVEITKLSLWLKTANKHDPLTSLDKNIICGNSIVESKLYDKKGFKWHDSFKDIIDKGGFDIIIGNPPYVRQERIEKNIKEYFKDNYKVYDGRGDLYIYFFEKAIKMLNNKGIMGFICSSKYTKVGYGKKLRKYIVDNCCIDKFIDFGDLELFKNITAYPSIIILNKNDKKLVRESNPIQYCKFKNFNANNIENYIHLNSELIKQDSISEKEWNFKSNNSLLNYDKHIKKLKDVIGAPRAGVKTGKNDAFIIDKESADLFIRKDNKNKDIIKPYIVGEDIKAYYAKANKYIIFPYKEIDESLSLVDIDDYPDIKTYLEKYKAKLENRAIIKDGIKSGKKKWYEYQQINKSFSLKKEYIVYPDIAKCNSFSTSVGNVIDMTVFWIETKEIEKHLAILNSKYLNDIIDNIAVKAKGGYNRYKNIYMCELPYPDMLKLDLLDLDEIKEIQKLYSDYENLNNYFIKYIEKIYKPKSISTKLTQWKDYEYGEFVSELEHQCTNIDESKKFDLMKLFDDNRDKLNEIYNKILEYQIIINEEIKNIYEKSTEFNS